MWQVLVLSSPFAREIRMNKCSHCLQSAQLLGGQRGTLSPVKREVCYLRVQPEHRQRISDVEVAQDGVLGIWDSERLSILLKDTGLLGGKAWIEIQVVSALKPWTLHCSRVIWLPQFHSQLLQGRNHSSPFLQESSCVGRTVPQWFHYTQE